MWASAPPQTASWTGRQRMEGRQCSPPALSIPPGLPRDAGVWAELSRAPGP